MSARSAEAPAVPTVERLTLVVGLLFCVTTWVFFVTGRGTFPLAAASPTAVPEMPDRKTAATMQA